MSENNERGDWLKLTASLAVCLGVGFAGSLLTRKAVPAWYAGLNKPWFNPPGWIFAPVWTLLYILMAVSFFLIWKGGLSESERRHAAIAFGVQLFLNALWTPVFFGLRLPGTAFGVIIILLAAIVYTTYLFRRHSKLAGVLLYPYIVWVAFAALLNFSIWRLN